MGETWTIAENWTARLVLERLIDAVALHSAHAGALALGTNQPTINGPDLLAAADEVFRDDPEKRKHFILHCWAKADGTEISELCQRYGWPVQTHYRCIEQASGSLAAWLRERFPVAPSLCSDGRELSDVPNARRKAG